jgi:general secretion pathway protein D
MRATTIMTVVTNMAFEEDRTNGMVVPQMANVEFGPVLDTVANVLADGYTIDLIITASFTEFLGYDETTNTTAHYTKTGVKVDVPDVLPRIVARQASAHLNVWDGQTVVLGGMIIPSIQTTKDKVPFLGDLPVLGHLFRSQSKTEIKKNLLVFVTATIVDPAGNRIHSDDEMPFAKDGVPVQPNH